MKYHTIVNREDLNSSHMIAYHYVQNISNGRALKVLEVGCSAGYFGSMLCETGHTVWGIEPDKEPSSEAEKVLDRVFQGDLSEFFSKHPDERFDVIVFGDVLEHLISPDKFLSQSHKHLSKDGHVIASIPNVAHISVRAMLFEGRWDYNELGIMDETHLRFYTKNTITDLFSNANFFIDEIQYTRLSVTDIEIATGSYCNKEVVELIESVMHGDPSLDIFQYVVLASSDSSLPNNFVENTGSKMDVFSNEYVKLNNNLSSRNKELEEELDIQTKRSSGLEQSIDKIKKSTSWRITKAIRVLGRLVKK